MLVGVGAGVFVGLVVGSGDAVCEGVSVGMMGVAGAPQDVSRTRITIKRKWRTVFSNKEWQITAS
jgi:hypothetical protein